MKRGGGGADWRGKYLQKIGAVTTSAPSNEPHLSSLLSSSTSSSSVSVTASGNDGQLIAPTISALTSVAASLPIPKGNNESSPSTLLTNGGVNTLAGDSISGSGLAISLPYDDSRSTPEARTPISPIQADDPPNDDAAAAISSSIGMTSARIGAAKVSNGKGGGGGGGGAVRRSVGNIDDSDIFGYGLELSSGGLGAGVASRGGINQSSRGGVGGGVLQHRLSMQSSTEYGEGDSGSQDGSQRESDRLSDTTGSSIPHEGGVWSGLPGAQRVVHNDNLSAVNAVHWRSQLELQKQRLKQLSEFDLIDTSLDNSLPEAPAPINALAAAASLQKRKKEGGRGLRAGGEEGIIDNAMAALTFSGGHMNKKEDKVTIPPTVPLMGLSLEGRAGTGSTSKPLGEVGVGGGRRLVELDEVEEGEEGDS